MALITLTTICLFKCFPAMEVAGGSEGTRASERDIDDASRIWIREVQRGIW